MTRFEFVCSEPKVDTIPAERISTLIDRAQAKLTDAAAASQRTGAVTLLPVVRDIADRLQQVLDLISDFAGKTAGCPFRGDGGEVEVQIRGGEVIWTCPLCCTQHVDGGPDD